MHHLLPNRNFESLPPSVFPPLDSVAWGFDFYGLWKTLEINGVQQTMRWIPPGEFMMGSPEGEPERGSDEVMHRVKLTSGFWLADTTCTQELWKAAGGKNLSEFKGDQRPADGVSWKDVQLFIKRVAAIDGGFNIVLPTEAQWEYACRAGTDTPFNMGNNIDPTIVNYDGNFPYQDGKQGDYRRETVDVKFEGFPPNRWGLWQMHGNVLEWCEDWYDRYEMVDVSIDPNGPVEGEGRVLRGGCWIDVAGFCRSAYRCRDSPSRRGSSIGFRFAQIDPPKPRSDSQ